VQLSGLQVFGVYISWRGRIVHKVNPVVDAATWLFKEGSFYSRKNAATRISSSTPITEAIFTLIKTARRDTPGNSRLRGYRAFLWRTRFWKKRWHRHWSAPGCIRSR
jgi:hypothetical protein